MTHPLFKYLEVKDPRINNLTANDPDFLKGVAVTAELGGIKRLLIVRPNITLSWQFKDLLHADAEAIEAQIGSLPKEMRLKLWEVINRSAAQIDKVKRAAYFSSNQARSNNPLLAHWGREMVMKLLGHALGDRFLTNSDYEGFAISEACRYVLAYFADPQEGAARKAKFAPLAAALPLIEQAKERAEAWQKLRMAGFEEGLLACQQLAKDFNAAVTRLRPGEQALFPGGWADKRGGHAMYYLIHREIDGTFTFRAYNTGAGSEYHTPKKGDKIPSSFCIEGLLPDSFEREGEALFRQLLDQGMAKRYNHQDPLHSAGKLYEKILAKMLLPVWGGRRSELSSAYFITPQRSGTCVWQGLMALLLDFSGSQKLYKEFVLDIKIATLAYALEVTKVSSADEMHERLLLRCARQLSASVSNRNKQGFTDAASRKKALDGALQVENYLKEQAASRPLRIPTICFLDKPPSWQANTYFEPASQTDFSSVFRTQTKPLWDLPDLTVLSAQAFLAQLVADVDKLGPTSLEALACLETTILALNRLDYAVSKLSAEQAEALMRAISKLSEVYFARASLHGQGYYKTSNDLSCAVDAKRHAYLTILLTLTDKCMRLVPQGLQLLEGLSLPIPEPYHYAYAPAAVSDPELLLELENAASYMWMMSQKHTDKVNLCDFHFDKSGRLLTQTGGYSSQYLERLLAQSKLSANLTDKERTLTLLRDLDGEHSPSCHWQLILSFARLHYRGDILNVGLSQDSSRINTYLVPRAGEESPGHVVMRFRDDFFLSTNNRIDDSSNRGPRPNLAAIRQAEIQSCRYLNTGFDGSIHAACRDVSNQTRELRPPDRYLFALLNQEGRVADSLEFFRGRIDLILDESLPWGADFVRTLFLPNILVKNMRGNPAMVAKLAEFCRFGYERASVVENTEAAAYFCALDHLFSDCARRLGMDTACFGLGAELLAIWEKSEGFSLERAAVLSSFCILSLPGAPIQRFAEWNCLFKTLAAHKMPPRVGVLYPAIIKAVQARAHELEQLQASSAAREVIWSSLASQLGHTERYEPALGDAVHFLSGALYIRGEVATQLPLDGNQAAKLAEALGSRKIAWRCLVLAKNWSDPSIYEGLSGGVRYAIKIWSESLDIWRKRPQDTVWQNYIQKAEGIPSRWLGVTSMWAEADLALHIEDLEGNPLATATHETIRNTDGYILQRADDSAVSSALANFEEKDGIFHWQSLDASGHIWTLPRFGMRFTLENEEAVWEQNPSYRLVQAPTTIATAPEFKQFLLLDDGRELRCLVPRAALLGFSGHSLLLNPIDTARPEKLSYFTFKLDETGALLAQTREEGLFLALVHAGQRQYEAALAYLNPLKVQRLGGFTSQEAEIIESMLDFMEYSGDVSFEAKALYIHFVYLVMKTGIAELSRGELWQFVRTQKNLDPANKAREPREKLLEILLQGSFLKPGHPLFIRPFMTRTLDFLFGIHRAKSHTVSVPAPIKQKSSFLRSIGTAVWEVFSRGTEVDDAAHNISYSQTRDLRGKSGEDVPKLFLLTDGDAFREAPLAFLQGLLSEDSALHKELVLRIKIMMENTECVGYKKILQGLLHLPTLSKKQKAYFTNRLMNGLKQGLIEVAALARGDAAAPRIPRLPPSTPDDLPERKFPARTQVPLLAKALSFEIDTSKKEEPQLAPLPDDLVAAFDTRGLVLTRTEKREFERLEADTRMYLSQQAEAALQLDPARRDEVSAKRDALAPKVASLAVELEAFANKPTEDETELILHRHELFSGHRKKITLDDCLISFLQNDASRLLAHNPNLVGQESALANLIQDYLLEATQLHRLENTLERLDDFDREKDVHFLVQAHALYEGKRAYNPNTNRAAFVFEYYRRISLRPEQVALIGRMQKGAEMGKSEVHQLLMGAGKSKVLLPILAYILSTGDKVPFVLVDEALFASNSNDLRTLSSGALQQGIETITVPQQKAMDIADVRAIRDALERAKAEKGFILTTWKSIHLLRMEWLSQVVEMASSPARQRPLLDDIYADTVAIRNACKQDSLSLPDEADRCNDLLKAYNRALGDTVQIVINERNLVLDLVHNVLDEKAMAAALGFSQTLESVFDTPAYLKYIARPLANQMLLKMGEDFDVHCPNTAVESMLDYLSSSDKLDKRPAWLEAQEPAFKDVAASAKFMLKEVLPLVASRNPNRHYGLSHVQDTFYAIPYAEKGVPAEGSQFANPFETMLYTMLYYIKCGVHAGAVAFITEQLKAQALDEFNRGGVRMENTAGCRKFAEMRPKTFAKTLFQVGTGDHVVLAVAWSVDQHFICQLVHDFILETIPIVAEYVTSTPFTLFDFFSCEQGFTGTVGNKGSWHRSLRANVTPGTDGKTVALLWKMKQDALIVPSVKEGLDPLFEQCKGYNVLIDLASWFRDRGNTEVAGQLANTLIGSGPIKGIVYYNDQDSPKGSKGLAVVIKAAGSTPVLLADCGLKPEELFTYYNFTVGADIKQALDAKALLTIDNNTTFEAFAQAFWRMRGVDGKQSVRLAARPLLTESLQSSSCAAMLRHFVKNQGALQEKQNLKKLALEADSLLKSYIEDALALLPVEEVRKKAALLKDLLVEDGNICAYDAVGNVSTHILISAYWAEIVQNVTNRLKYFGNAFRFRLFQQTEDHL